MPSSGKLRPAVGEQDAAAIKTVEEHGKSVEPRGTEQAGSPGTILELLADDASRAILSATADDRKTVNDLVNVCDIPTPTAYRKVNALVQAGLLDKTVRIRPDGNNINEYELGVETIDIQIAGQSKSAVRVSFSIRPSSEFPQNMLTDGGEIEEQPPTHENQHRLGSLFESVTGTDEVVERQEITQQTRILDEADTAVSDYVSEATQADGLGDSLPCPQGEDVE